MENTAGSVTPLPHNQLGIQVVSAASAGAFIDMVVISLRLWSRRLKKRRLAIGDYLIIVAWIFVLGDLIRKIIAMNWGVGLHMNQILATDPTHLMDAAKITYAGYFLWICAVTCIKLSILCLYHELFYCKRWFVWCVRATMAICLLYLMGFMVGLCVQCTPFEANYNPAASGAKCGISRSNGFLLSGSINFVLDFILVVLPLPVIWTLKISGPKRLGVSAMFSLGVLILITVGIRFKLIKETNPLDFIHDGEPPGILISLELYLGIISACLPFLSPPIGKMRISIVESGFMGYIGSFTSLGGSRGTKHTSSDIQNQASWELGDRSDHSHERLTPTHVIMVRDDPSLGKQADAFTMNPWPETNGYGRHYKVEHNPDPTRVDRDTLKGITLTNEWDVHVVENHV